MDEVPTDSPPKSPLPFIGIIALILVAAVAGILVISFLSQRRERYRVASCGINLRQIGLALTQYAQDNMNHYPHATADGYSNDSSADPAVPVDGGPNALVDRLYPAYLPDERSFRCPTTPPGSGERTSYGYDPRHLWSHKPAVVIVADRPPSGQPRAGENSPNHNGDGQNVLYIDCHAEWKKTTNVGYADDEIYVDNTGEAIGDYADNRRDSCILGYGGSIGP